MYSYMYVCMYVCMDGCMYVCMDGWMYGCIYIYIYACMYVCMYVYIYIYVCMYACIASPQGFLRPLSPKLLGCEHSGKCCCHRNQHCLVGYGMGSKTRGPLGAWTSDWWTDDVKTLMLKPSNGKTTSFLWFLCFIIRGLSEKNLLA